MEQTRTPQPRPRLLDRPATRRALLAGTAAAAAGGTAFVVAGLARDSSDSAPAAASPEALAANPDASTAAAAQAEAALDTPIADPRLRAAHLLRRAGFGGTPAEVDEFAALSKEDAADRLLAFETIDNSALDARIAAANFNLTTPGQAQGRGRLLVDMQRWWLTRMAYTARPLEERMTLIWHGLLTSQVTKIGPQRAKLMVEQNELFRANALPKYGVLLKAITRDPAMLIYLDSIESTAASPNENFARELMELYSMGVGNYTEEDVRASARAFTGYRLNRPNPNIPPGLSERERQDFLDNFYGTYDPEFVMNQRQHDSGAKTFLARTGPWGGDDIVDIIMEQPATARYMTRRLFTEFANYNPSDETLAGLVAVWDESGADIRQVVRAILVSDEFYSLRSYRGFVRSPVEFVVGAVRGLELETQFQGIQQFAGGMDQVLFEPPSVAGWPGGSTWLSSATFFARANYLDATLFQRGRPIPIASLAAPTPEESVDRTLTRLVDDNVTPEARDSLYAFARTVSNPTDRAAAVAYLVLASPEFQLV